MNAVEGSLLNVPSKKKKKRYVLSTRWRENACASNFIPFFTCGIFAYFFLILGGESEARSRNRSKGGNSAFGSLGE